MMTVKMTFDQHKKCTLSKGPSNDH